MPVPAGIFGIPLADTEPVLPAESADEPVEPELLAAPRAEPADEPALLPTGDFAEPDGATEPEEPDEPEELDVPDEPVAPGEPDVPEAPDEPDELVEPGKPIEPEELPDDEDDEEEEPLGSGFVSGSDPQPATASISALTI